MENLQNKINDLKSNIQEMVDYLNLKVKSKDWHAVADAAMDIREYEAKIQILESLK